MRYKKIGLSILLVGMILGLFLWNKMRAGQIMVDENMLIDRITYLSSPELDGRLAGTEGYNKTALYIENQLKELGIEGFFKGGYRQEVFTEGNEFIGDPHFSIDINGEEIKPILGSDYLFRCLSGTGSVKAEMVFCGYGISEPLAGYDDYAQVDVKGKVVMIIKENPIYSIKGVDITKITTRYKTKKAIEHGAMAVIYVNSIHQTYIPKPIGSVMDGEGYYSINIPQLHIDRKLADQILGLKNWNLAKCQSLIDDMRRSFSFSIPAVASISVRTHYQSKVASDNIVSVVKGSDKQLKDEYIVVGAHADHVGRQATNFYFPGANDNATGVSALLEVAGIIKKAKIKPKRSIVFVFFTGEESGLFGSKEFVKKLDIPANNIVAMINLDCVGHGDSLKINGADKAPELWQKAKQLDENHNRIMMRVSESSDGTDAEPFNKIGIPTLSFVSEYSYTHIHQHTDTLNTLNKPLLVHVTNLLYRLCAKLADDESNDK